MWALLGHLSIDLTYDDIGDLHHIVASYDHPNHQYNQIANDITLYKLRNRIEITPYVRPACLLTSNLNQLNSKLQTASWENIAISNKLYGLIYSLSFLYEVLPTMRFYRLPKIQISLDQTPS